MLEGEGRAWGKKSDVDGEWQKGGEDFVARFGKIVKRIEDVVQRKTERVVEFERVMKEHQATLADRKAKLEGTRLNVKDWGGNLFESQ